MVGNGGVGKSSMIRRFCTGEYTDTYKKTIGVDFLEKEKYIDRSVLYCTVMRTCTLEAQFGSAAECTSIHVYNMCASAPTC